MSPQDCPAIVRRPLAAAGSFVAALLLLFVVLGAAFGGAASILAKSVASPFGHGSQLLRSGGSQQRFRAALDVDRAAIPGEQQRTRAASCGGDDEAAAVHAAPSTCLAARAAAGPSRVDSRCGLQPALGYLSRAPPTAA